ncbi:hypothetical protein GGS21DRAFT_545841 [Xylaria nigripes]|nr:hypothetical protein GGS21DRAFT_545841 [Xylaria nigripes]
MNSRSSTSSELSSSTMDSDKSDPNKKDKTDKTETTDNKESHRVVIHTFSKARYDKHSRRIERERAFLLSRKRCGSALCPEEIIQVIDTKNHIHTVKVAQLITCDCSCRGELCQHVVFVLAYVLKVPNALQHLVAFSPSDLCMIFKNTWPVIKDAKSSVRSKPQEQMNKECPVCFLKFTSTPYEAVLYCRAHCGYNMHEKCLSMWFVGIRMPHEPVLCPVCLNKWEGDPNVVEYIKARINGRTQPPLARRPSYMLKKNKPGAPKPPTPESPHNPDDELPNNWVIDFRGMHTGNGRGVSIEKWLDDQDGQYEPMDKWNDRQDREDQWMNYPETQDEPMGGV